MRVDYHLHTNFSTDSQESMELYCESAIKQGIKEIAVTDHVDLGVVNEYTSEQVVDYPNYAIEIKRLQEKYKDKVCLRKGLEFGVQLEYLDEYKEIVRDNDLDFVIMSCHQIDNKEFWLNDYQKNKTPYECFEGYYKYLMELVRVFPDFSVIGHLDLMKRYSTYTPSVDDEHEAIIKELLQLIIDHNKGIEVNTSGIRYDLGSFHPSEKILRWYYELGGTIITVGSDAHILKDLGSGIDEALAMLKEIGFESVCTFEKMQPIFHKL